MNKLNFKIIWLNDNNSNKKVRKKNDKKNEHTNTISHTHMDTNKDLGNFNNLNKNKQT